MKLDKKILIAGHSGMVGSACFRLLKKNGYSNLIGCSSSDVDLRNQRQVSEYISKTKPDIIIDAAAKVGGILANDSFPYQFLLENMQIQNNLISTAHENDIEKFIFLGSSCIYPKLSKQPIKEEYLLTDSLESTNEWYSIAKISGIKLCQSIRKQFGKDFVSLMPTNLYGPFDNFNLKTSHVLPAMIRKFHEAKIKNRDVFLWGSGKPLREFLHVDDLARAILFALENVLPEHLYNVGSGNELSIKDLSLIVQNKIGHHGEIFWDNDKPDGSPRKLMDSSKMYELGWKPKITLENGIENTYSWFLKNH
tara:strand:+ start:2376 stop:3299 length:924 start_codon:yes stop_codon:yes gene_type:complete